VTPVMAPPGPFDIRSVHRTGEADRLPLRGVRRIKLGYPAPVVVVVPAPDPDPGVVGVVEVVVVVGASNCTG
jgi:hypothetical protein